MEGRSDLEERAARELGDAVKKNRRILIVEDEPDVALSISLRLRAWGFEPLVANTGKMAKTHVLDYQPAAVLMDVGLPDGDGFAIAQGMRADGRTAAIPIIFLTARTSEQDQRRAAELQSFAYVTKPFKTEELYLVLRASLL